MEQQKEENQRKMRNIEKYMDVITCDFAYDPVKLPIDQDPIQAVYDRKTLETIWETTHHARNPFTRQWFHIKSVIPQSDLRLEMQQHLEHNEFSAEAAEFDVIAEYTKIIEKEQMKQHLKMLRDGVSEGLGLQNQYWVTMWNKINLLRLYCQYHDENIQTFRDLNGFTYLYEIINQTALNTCIKQNKKICEAALDVSKEIVRVFDVIGFRSSDIVDILEAFSMEISVFGGLISILHRAYKNNDGYLKIQSVALRLLCKLYSDNIVQAHPDNYRPAYWAIPPAMDKLLRFEATDISSKDLNYAIDILRCALIFSLDFINKGGDSYVKAMVNAVNLCIARAIQIPEKSGLSEAQLVEAEEENLHNFEALEKGLSVMNDILKEGGSLADTAEKERLSIVPDIHRVFTDNINYENGIDCRRGCNTSGCVHNRAALLALEVIEAMFKRKHSRTQD